MFLVVTVLGIGLDLRPGHPKHHIAAVLGQNWTGQFIGIIERAGDRWLPAHPHMHMIGGPFIGGLGIHLFKNPNSDQE